MITMEASFQEATQGSESHDLLARAFGLGWAAADEAHLPALPAALARLVGVPAATVAVLSRDGNRLMEYSFPPPHEREARSPQLVFEVDEPLGEQYTFRVTVEQVVDLSPAQTETLDAAVALVKTSLESILVRQRDRAALGEPFASLSEREWLICLALERPNGEKQIADGFSWSRHTLHSYIKGMYRKMKVQSRLQLLDQLKTARDGLRRRTLESFSPGRDLPK